MPGRWPALQAILAAGAAGGPPRIGSMIVTVFGDAIAPRSGEVALTALLLLMRRLGAADSAVRTALSRLTADAWLERTRAGADRFYALGPARAAEFAAATPRVYGPLTRPWSGRLRIVFADATTDRDGLGRAGFVLVAPGVLIAPDTDGPPGTALHLSAPNDAAPLRALAARAWPLAGLAADYAGFVHRFEPLRDEAPGLPPLDAMAARVTLIHAYRRIVLRDPRLPDALLPEEWPGHRARLLCSELYTGLAAGSEAWLDTVANRSGPLPKGPDPGLRFSGVGLSDGGR